MNAAIQAETDCFAGLEQPGAWSGRLIRESRFYCYECPCLSVRLFRREVGAMSRILISSGSPYEPMVGISRAVRVGSMISVAGTAPLDAAGRTVAPGNPAAQARRCLEIIRTALEQAGASLRDVVRTRTLLTRIEDWRAVAEVHGEYFGEIRPANTIMQVTRFVDPDWLVEMEADAVVDQEAACP